MLIAAVLWFVMFSPWTAPYLNFWWAMSASALVLMGLAWTGRATWGNGAHEAHGAYEAYRAYGAYGAYRIVGIGLLIAVALWLVFWVGDKVSQWLFHFARQQVDLIYGMKDGMSPWMLSLLLLCIIGPAEEIFWRGYVQRTLAQRWSPNVAFVVTTAIYALVHLPSLNFMLIMAALVCGVAWGGLYRLMPERLPAIILSHALWDAAAFVWFPL